MNIPNDGALALIAILFLVFTIGTRPPPPSSSRQEEKDIFRFGPLRICLIKIIWKDFKARFVSAPISLSILNFVIVVCKLLGGLFPELEALVMPVSVSVGLMNFMGCWFRAMPCLVSVDPATVLNC
ncbi:hypothetical protein VNO78_07234 [Psophocarpus tetragonolobus]|uniref:Uncharacterized protein n=1 Tax=Psophocarpus tetragonolobus TaxID=3891 RepID=A0AAN9T2U0_PSOTE